MMKQLESPITRFRNALQVEQTKSSMKWPACKIVLFKNVREDPEAITFDEAIRFHHGLGNKGRRVRLVVQRVARVRGSVPLGVINRQSAGARENILRLFTQDA